MLTSPEVKRYAHARRITLLDQAWKDYLQDLVLSLLYRQWPSLLFRGGTCIWKVMHGDRFSEDLDLCLETKAPGTIEEYLTKELSYYGFSCAVRRKKQTESMLFLALGITSPTHPREITLAVEILRASPCARRKETVTMYSPYPDIAPIEINVPHRDEIIADKIGAVCQRDKPRDIHDLYLLLKQGGHVDMVLVQERIPHFTIDMLREKLREKKRLWKSLGPLVVTKLPSFDEEVAYITSFFACGC